jgi:hypothetical protein
MRKLSRAHQLGDLSGPRSGILCMCSPYLNGALQSNYIAIAGTFRCRLIQGKRRNVRGHSTGEPRGLMEVFCRGTRECRETDVC